MGDQVWQELRLELCQGGRRLSLVLGRMAFGRRLGVLRTCGSNQIWGCLRWRLCNEGESTGGATQTAKKRSGSTARHLQRFWTQLSRLTAKTVLDNVRPRAKITGGATSLQSL